MASAVAAVVAAVLVEETQALLADAQSLLLCLVACSAIQHRYSDSQKWTV